MNWITAILEIGKQLSKPFASWWLKYQIRKEFKDRIKRLEARDKRRRELDMVLKAWKEATTHEGKSQFFNLYLDRIRDVD